MNNQPVFEAQRLVGESPCFEATLRAAKLIAATDATVLIQGESGTGKELLAQSVHHHSKRREQAFISINCAALPEALAESELFGHRKGAFTGAHADNVGRIRHAEGGSLFLDEIGELSLAIQAKLLRFLESGECQAVGDHRSYYCNVRVIAATNRDLYTRVQQGQFREDLFYRLNVVPLQIPPLRERNGDLKSLLDHFVQLFSQRHELSPPRFNKIALKQLQKYHWPGNVRELRNVAERMLILFSGSEVGPENLPHEIRHPATTQAGRYVLGDAGVNLEELERDIIQQALNKSSGNKSRAARLLGLTRDTFLYRLKKYELR